MNPGEFTVLPAGWDIKSLMKRAILVKSCVKNLERRNAIDATWAGELRSVGAGPVFSVLADLSVEAGIQSNVIHATSGDDYGDNSLKLKFGLWVCLKAGDFTHLFICDDDTFVHPKRWLAHEPTGEFECRLFHPVTDADVKRNGGRPWANGGAGWWMSRRLCELYVAEVTERCSWDDILATRIAQEHGVPISDRPDLYTCSRYGDTARRVSADNQVITCHPVEPAEMVEMWEACRLTADASSSSRRVHQDPTSNQST